MISPTKLLALLDILAASYYTGEAEARHATLLTLTPALVGGDGVSSFIYGTGDETFILKAASVVTALQATSTPDTQNTLLYNPWFQMLNGYLSSIGGANYNDLNSYATYVNESTAYSFLLNPVTATQYFLIGNKAASLRLTAGNVFAPPTSLGSATVGAAAGHMTFTTTAGILIANDLVGNVQGFAAAPGAAVHVTTAINGTFTLHIAATGTNAAGAAVAGRSWDVVLDNAVAGTVIPLVPGTVGDRLSKVTYSSSAGAATAGAFNVMTTTDR